MSLDSFAKAFECLTGDLPFPWQQALYDDWFALGKIPPSCNIPTGLGKTNVIAIWLIALLKYPDKMPRRLVYVVNRRTVVDQTTNEVEIIRRNLSKLESLPEHLRQLAISTLRGQFADNREWSADPSRPAVICGTVDMIGSRLLFSGYNVGFKGKPLHAGFLGQDTLLVHDEAHLEPAFQKLLEAIQQEQTRCSDFRPLRVMELTATSRTSGNSFSLSQDDYNDATVKKRLNAKKAAKLHALTDASKLADHISNLAMEHRDSGSTVVVFARTVDDVLKVREKLSKAKLQVETLTGTLRGKERDELIKTPEFQRFLPESNRDKNVSPAEGTVYLVCTSAGEVGVNISADHMVCDLSTFESMAQRFGRVNRFGECDDTRIDIVYPATFDEKDRLTPARQATLTLLQQLNGNGSPAAFGKLDAEERRAAFAPEPITLPVTDILFDAWALTTIRDKMPGRPPVESYLHGVEDWQPAETYVAWRQEVWELWKHQPVLKDGNDEGTFAALAQGLLEDFPLKPHELLREPSYRAFKHFEALAKRLPDAPVWLLDEQRAVEVFTLGELADKNRKDRIKDCTVLLPPEAGGLLGGMLDGNSERADDVSCGWFDKGGYWHIWMDEKGHPDRARLWSSDDKSEYDRKTDGMRLIRSIEFELEEGAEEANPRTWDWYESRPLEGGRAAKKPVAWDTHVGDVIDHAKQIVAGLSLPQEIADAVVLAAELHDHGKRRERFQITLGNRDYPAVLLAKSGKKGSRLSEPFRHEFASVLDAQDDPTFKSLSEDMQDLVLHLIATHHGRARPHFSVDEAFDPDHSMDGSEALARETPRRFARLQRKYGRWGLAYLESLLRAADWAASAEPSAFLEEKQ